MRFQHVFWLVVAAVLGAASACGTEQFSSPILSDENFAATLAGTNVVPPVTTTATGTVQIAIVSDTFIVFRVAVSGLDSATSARIHAQAAGASDTTPVARVFTGVACRNASNQPINTSSPSCRLGYTGQLSEGQFKPSQIDTLYQRGVTPRVRFDSLVARLRAGTAYLQVHTKLNPSGAIRGQIQSAP